MPWSTPALRDVRSLVRDAVNASLPGADANVPNSVLRVMSDNQGALCHLTLQYIDWLALQLLPDTSETEWLDRHGQIWLVNSDGTIGRKMATLSQGTATFFALTVGINTVIPNGSQLISGGTVGISGGLLFETVGDITSSTTGSQGVIRAVDPGKIGNLLDGASLAFTSPINGVSPTATVGPGDLEGGTDTETDDELRARILKRIQQPPMGGDAADFENWALAVPGVTRAWCYPLEMGIGTVTTRFMCDDLRAEFGGFPLPVDVAAVTAYIDSKRPVAVKDSFVEAPLPMPVDMTFFNLSEDTDSMRAAIETALQKMLLQKAVPGGTIYRSWVEAAVLSAVGNATFELDFTTLVMPAPGYLGTLGTITYAG